MNESITAFVGLDVHKESIALAVAKPGRAAPRFVGTTAPVLPELEKALRHLGSPSQLLIVYEAGPCGYGLARQLCARGYRCELVAPTKIPPKPGDRIKTDRCDALSLAHFARCGDLRPVLIPAESDEVPDCEHAISSRPCCCHTGSVTPGKPPGPLLMRASWLG
jgi:transposase